MYAHVRISPADPTGDMSYVCTQHHAKCLIWQTFVSPIQGITTSVTLIDVTVAETKHVGVLVLYMGALADPVEVQMNR